MSRQPECISTVDTKLRLAEDSLTVVLLAVRANQLDQHAATPGADECCESRAEN